jgi:hypothetical protein
MMPDVRFDTYYRHEDLAGIVQMYAEQYPHLVRVETYIPLFSVLISSQLFC